ncbi:MAG: hypothetical protein IPJ77_11395 [Planctomycetes bacterium]|nr:hypothetical protein [Planctomycetota bacterium]
MNHRTLLGLVCVLFLGFAASCAATAPAPQWVSSRVAAGNERLLLEVTELALRKTSFPVGAGLDPAHLTATSGWKISLAPFKGKGFREQAVVQFTREAGNGRYKAEVRVKRERNEDLVRPMDLTYAQWESEPDNVERARVVLHFIEALLSTGDEVVPKGPEKR